MNLSKSSNLSLITFMCLVSCTTDDSNGELPDQPVARDVFRDKLNTITEEIIDLNFWSEVRTEQLKITVDGRVEGSAIGVPEFLNIEFSGGRELYEAVRLELAPLRTVAEERVQRILDFGLTGKYAGYACGGYSTDGATSSVIWVEDADHQMMVDAYSGCSSPEVLGVADRLQRARMKIWCAASKTNLLSATQHEGLCLNQ